MMKTINALSLFLHVFLKSVDASAFLEAQRAGQGSISRVDVDQTLSELAGVSSHAGLHRIEDELRPMFLTLPKNARGALEPAAVRYALHRYFVEKHGWYMKGLEPSAGSSQLAISGSIMKERAPVYIQSILEKRLGGQGFGLHELAVFAATMTELVHNEATQDLHHVFVSLGHDVSGEVSRIDVDHAIKTFFATHTLELDVLSIAGANAFDEMSKEVAEGYPNWEATEMWLQDLRFAYDFSKRSSQNPFVKQPESFSRSAEFVRHIGDKFGDFQQLECRDLKSKLVDMEYQGTGRVRLSSFYGRALEGDFTETPELLRLMGALDETDPARPSVIITNYLTSQSNCLRSSGFYAVCCLNECEGLLQHIESAVAGPSAPPRRLVELVSELASDTVSAPRNLSASLVGRLEEVAKYHGGTVPLHGRLFAQWLHHAYPRECPFPHVSGSVENPSLESLDSDLLVITEEEMRRHQEMPEDTDDAAVTDLPWTETEELLGSYGYSAPQRAWCMAALRPFVGLAALASVLTAMLRSSKVAFGEAETDDKHFV